MRERWHPSKYIAAGPAALLLHINFLVDDMGHLYNWPVIYPGRTLGPAGPEAYILGMFNFSYMYRPAQCITIYRRYYR